LDANAEVWREIGDLGHQAERAWKHLIAGRDLLLAESLDRQLESMRVELGGADPSPLEMLLVQRILATWLMLHHADITATQMHGATPAQHVAAAKRQNLAQQRHLAAVRALATLRKYLRPTLSPVDIASRLEQDVRPTHHRMPKAPLVGVQN
jgi:hypothetical protein